MGERFHLPSAPAAGGRAWLEDDEGRHLARVLRARPGDVVRVFDGAGREASARVVEVERGRVLLEVLADVVAPKPARHVVLCTAIPRGERMQWLVEKTVEAGVGRIVPVAAARSVRQEARENTLRRWRRAAVEAAKQCGRADVPEVREPCPLEEALAESAGMPRFVALPGSPVPLREAWGTVPPMHLALFIGPEGGFDPAETEALSAEGATPFGLGGLVLRVETAALVAVHSAAW